MMALDALYGAALALNGVSAFLHLFCHGDPRMGLFSVLMVVILLAELV